MENLPTIILIRGLGRHSLHWGDFVKKIQAAYPMHTVATHDLLGNGDFYEETSPICIKKYTEHLYQRLDKNKQHWIVAISMGAMVGLDLLSRYSHIVSKLVVMNTSLSNLSSPWERFSPKVFFVLPYKLFFSNAVRQEEFIYELTAKMRVPDHLFWEALIKDKKRTRKLNILRQLLAASFFKAPKINGLKLLVLASCGDELVEHSSSKKIALHYGTANYLHPRAGHDLPFDDGEWIIEKVRTFFVLND